jgi:2-polyprenyl-3-methyl-5-hydroxy-6-metoxy-1,4-benzoquinol methylase
MAWPGAHLGKKQGWFHTEGRLGDRMLKTQLIGLGPLFDEIAGKSVLDVGCAEGLISLELVKRGARMVDGVEIVAGHIEIANGLAVESTTFHVADANVYEPVQAYDVVLFLALLHKLKNPTEAAKRICAWCLDLCVVRLPPSGPVIIDDRSEREPHDIAAALLASGFVLEKTTEGPYREWMGYFRRRKESRTW